MKEYRVIYKGLKKSEEVMVPDKKALIRVLFDGDETKFRSEVKSLVWSTCGMQYVEDIQNEKIHAEITTADVNPYGWRNA